MTRNVKLTVGLVAGGVLIAGGALGVGVVIASDGEGPAAGTKNSQTETRKRGNGAHSFPGHAGTSGQGGQGTGLGDGRGHGNGQDCQHDGNGDDGITAKSGKLTDVQKATLISLAEEEKLAHDLYSRFADRYDTQVFDHILQSEVRHLDDMRMLLDRYRIDDPTQGRKVGSFADATTQRTYDQLLRRGTSGKDEALEVGRTVEKADINDLTQALEGLDAPDATQVYGRLVEASKRHLSAFERTLDA